MIWFPLWVLPLYFATGSSSSNRQAAPIAPRDRVPSGAIELPLENRFLADGGGGGYFVTLNIGTPPQPVKLLLDTGSADLWVYGSKYRNGTHGAFFNELQSSTAQPADLPPFYAHYGGATQVENGKFITDNVLLGEILLNNVSMGLVESGYNWGLDYGGIFGLGWDFEERIHGNHSDKEVLYPSLMDVMYKEGYIESHLFALFMDDLNSPNGTLIFGGWDRAKHVGPQILFRCATNTMTVPLRAVSITDASGVTTQVGFYDPTQWTILDSGSWTSSGLPNDTFHAIVKHIENLGYQITNLDSYAPSVDCGLRFANGSIDITIIDLADNRTINPYFNNTFTASVQLSELGIPTTVNGTIQSCVLGIYNGGSGTYIAFGDTFMRAMFIVFALDWGVIALAEPKYFATDSDILPTSYARL